MSVTSYPSGYHSTHDERSPLVCRPATCKTCGNTTWAGCGQHVASVKAMVPSSQWCNGKHTPAEKAAAGNNGGGLMSRLFGR